MIGLGQGMALPSLIGTALAHTPPERAGAAAGILTTTQQFGVASGVAIIGAVFYARLGPGRASSVSAMELAMAIDAVVALAAAALTLLLPRRAAARRPAMTGGLRVDGDVPAEQHVADDLPGVPGRVLRSCGHVSAPC